MGFYNTDNWPEKSEFYRLPWSNNDNPISWLEITDICNIYCKGCYRKNLTGHRTLDELKEEVDLFKRIRNTDGISIAGGEPLIYPHIEELVGKILAQRRHVYLCTNGVLLEKKLHGFPPSDRLFINVHIDGMEETHDRIVGREGVFQTATRGIGAAKSAGFRVCTNTTIYRDTDMHEVAVLFDYLTQLGVDTLMVSPAYGYEAVQDDDPDGAAEIFMTRRQVHEKFCRARRLLQRFKLAASPIYLDFLCGHRELPCAAWANPTYNVRGWRGPCYLIGDAHHETYEELLDATDWDELGPGGDTRCEHCLVHYGFEPSAVLSANRRVRDVLKMAMWQMT